MTEKTINNGSLFKASLAMLIEWGGIYYNVPGTSPKELLVRAIDLLPAIPSLDPKDLYLGILEREALV